MSIEVGIIGHGHGKSTLVDALCRMKGEQQSCESDLISRDKLLKDASNTITENSESMDWFNIINNQPQVQPIVRSAEEIADKIELHNKAIFKILKEKEKHLKCECIDTDKQSWLNWLTGKEM